LLQTFRPLSFSMPGALLCSAPRGPRIMCFRTAAPCRAKQCAAVLNHMVHGACGALRRDVPCMVDVVRLSVCTKKYPNDFQSAP